MNQDIQIVEQNGIRLVRMNIIELCRSEKNTIWNDGKTFLSVFDKNNKQVADYDFSTGLKIMENESEMIIFINDEDLVPGQWIFYGSKIKINGKEFIETKIQSNGFKDGKKKSRTYKDKDPWNKNRSSDKYVSATDREKRINICRSCDLFNAVEGICSINKMPVIEMTKHEISYCPELKWGDMVKSSEYLIKQTGIDADIEKEQKTFNDSLDEYLRGK